jgi:hypothetical protein
VACYRPDHQDRGSSSCTANHVQPLRHNIHSRWGTEKVKYYYISRQVPAAEAVLLEAGEPPLWARWLQRAGRLWNRLTAAPPDSLLHTAFDVSCQLAATAPATLPLARQSWAAQLAAALQGIGMPVDLARPRPLCLEQLKRSALRRHLHEIQAAAGRPGASKLAHYLAAAWAGQLPGAEEYVPSPAAYLGAVSQRSRRVALAQLRTGPHWLAEETQPSWSRCPLFPIIGLPRGLCQHSCAVKQTVNTKSKRLAAGQGRVPIQVALSCLTAFRRPRG